jgi:hypothetical protein
MPLSAKWIIGATFLAAAYTLLPATAFAGVVVAASGPSASNYPVGKKIGDSERIVLRAGDTLTVLDGNGTRVLRGAGTYSLDQQAGPSQRSTFAVLTERRSAQRMRTGAVRGEEEGVPRHAPNLWYVDVAKPGKVCLASTERVRLWRPTTEGDATYLVRADGGGSHTVTFADGDMLAPWDTKLLPVTDGAVFHIAGPAGGPDKQLSFVVLDPVAEEPEALAAQLIEHGCAKQLEVLSTATLIAER